MIKVNDLGIRLASAKQLGNYYLTGTKESVSAYKIVGYNEHYQPEYLEYVGQVSNDGNMSWDDAYDQIIGKPSKPDFSRILN